MRISDWSSDVCFPISQQYVHALWTLYRLEALDGDLMRNALKHEDPMVRTHVLRILAEMDAPGEEYYQAVSEELSDYDQHVQRAAVETLARYGRLSTIQTLVGFRNKISDYNRSEVSLVGKESVRT